MVRWNSSILLVALIFSVAVNLPISLIPMTSESFSYQGWQKKGVILYPSGWEGITLSEPNIIYENGTFKMWYRGGGIGGYYAGIGYATSTDGLTWTKYGSSPILGGALDTQYLYPFVMKNGPTYLLYTRGTVFKSPNGINWTLLAKYVIPFQSWVRDYILGDTCVWNETATSWYMIYDAMSYYDSWCFGLATSSDGVTWVNYENNPIMKHAGGADVHKVDGVYYMWYHNCDLPSDIHFAWSDDLHTWTNCRDNPVLWRTTADEGYMKDEGQVADACIVQQNASASWLAYDAICDQESVSCLKIAFTTNSIPSMCIKTA